MVFSVSKLNAGECSVRFEAATVLSHVEPKKGATGDAEVKLYREPACSMFSRFLSI